MLQLLSCDCCLIRWWNDAPWISEYKSTSNYNAYGVTFPHYQLKCNANIAIAYVENLKAN